MVEKIVVKDVEVTPEKSEMYLSVDLAGHEFILTPADAHNLIIALERALGDMRAAGWLLEGWEEE